tara:strand:- start:1018 stop:1599 length:582 start_codon:yes stop_codon:yes gene_type:complete
MNNKFFICSYKENFHNANKVKQNLIELDVKEKDIIIVDGYNCEKTNISPRVVCYYNFFDKIVPMVKTLKCNMYYIEDNTIIYENPNYFPKFKPIHWLGFIDNKVERNFINGSHLVYISYEIIKNIMYYNYFPTGIERLFCEIGQNTNPLKKTIKRSTEYTGIEIDKSITQIRPHFSRYLKKHRNWISDAFYLD